MLGRGGINVMERFNLLVVEVGCVLIIFLYLVFYFLVCGLILGYRIVNLDCSYID